MTSEPATSLNTHACYAIISPVRDEEGYIGEMIETIMAQTVPPSKWIIADDGSQDRTAEIVATYAQQHPAIHLLRLPERSQRLAGGEGAIPKALGLINLNEFDFLARFDADLSFPPDYIENMLTQFTREPALGIAGGVLYVERDGVYEIEKSPDYHVRGALKMYRVPCFQQIGGLSSQIGWDTVDEVTAWTLGWTTKSFSAFQVKHRRPTGKGIAPARVYRERGRGEYLTWSHPLFVLLKSLKLAISERSITVPMNYLTGFVRSYLHREKRLHNPAFTKTRRRQQLARFIGIQRTQCD